VDTHKRLVELPLDLEKVQNSNKNIFLQYSVIL
jgi:hypothetical protein